MRIHYLQHVPFENLGYIRQWIDGAGYEITATRFFNDEPLPEIHSFDWLIVMGGPMSVHDEDRYPWLRPEKAFIQEAIDKDKTVLGICLGAQLMAEAIGSSVVKAVQREIGWFPVRKNAANDSDGIFETMPDSQTVFHWHGETFDIPDGAVCLASSQSCRNQAFVYEKRVLGLQFHLEMTSDGVAQLIRNCAEDILPGPYVQTIEDMLYEWDYYETNQQILSAILGTLDGITKSCVVSRSSI